MLIVLQLHLVSLLISLKFSLFMLSRIKMPETYVVHLGNSKELMEVAENNVAKRVLREHIRELLGVRHEDILFAIINSKLTFLMINFCKVRVFSNLLLIFFFERKIAGANSVTYGQKVVGLVTGF